jgi:hypothetical protein
VPQVPGSLNPPFRIPSSVFPISITMDTADAIPPLSLQSAFADLQAQHHAAHVEIRTEQRACLLQAEAPCLQAALLCEQVKALTLESEALQNRPGTAPRAAEIPPSPKSRLGKICEAWRGWVGWAASLFPPPEPWLIGTETQILAVLSDLPLHKWPQIQLISQDPETPMPLPGSSELAPLEAPAEPCLLVVPIHRPPASEAADTTPPAVGSALSPR